MKYEVIIFDADETLFDFEKSEREALKNTMMEFNIDYDENYHLKVYKDINSVVWKEFENGLIIQSNLNIERFKRLIKSLNFNFDEEKFAKAYIKHLSYASFLYNDSLTSDIQGGLNSGIDTCWFNPNNIINNTSIKPTYKITNLMDLKNILEK